MERFEREIGVAECRYSGTRPVKPRIMSPQPDQLLVKPVGRPAERGQVRSRFGKCWADRVVPSGAVLLDTPKRLLVAGINRRQAAARHQDDQRMGKVPFIPQL